MSCPLNLPTACSVIQRKHHSPQMPYKALQGMPYLADLILCYSFSKEQHPSQGTEQARPTPSSGLVLTVPLPGDIPHIHMALSLASVTSFLKGHMLSKVFLLCPFFRFIFLCSIFYHVTYILFIYFVYGLACPQ